MKFDQKPGSTMTATCEDCKCVIRAGGPFLRLYRGTCCPSGEPDGRKAAERLAEGVAAYQLLRANIREALNVAKRARTYLGSAAVRALAGQDRL